MDRDMADEQRLVVIPGQKLLTVPRGLSGPGLPTTLTLDVTAIYKAESKLEEVRRATPHNWLSLATDFNLGYGKAVKFKALLRSELGLAKKSANMIKKGLTVDHLASFLKERGLRDSTDTREALYLSDSEYVAAMDRAAGLEAAIELMDAKAKTFVNAYQAVKKIADDRENTWFRGSDSGGGEDVT